jgi:hypothetical protein
MVRGFFPAFKDKVSDIKGYGEKNFMGLKRRFHLG